MIRIVLFTLFFLVLYSAVKAVFRSARRAYREEDPRTRIMGDEMVLCPECRTYVVKNRAVSRRIHGTPVFFCSDACALQHEQKTGK